MRPVLSTVLAGVLLQVLGASSAADPTWPSSVDEIEEIVYQLQGFRARLFSDVISPCTNEASGPGRQNAAEWLRAGFHDMATANSYFKTGGLDASLQFELTNGENTGPGHNTTLKFFANYFSSRASMADLIAAGVYASVRACGGPAVPLRLGRVDATEAGAVGVPQPQNEGSLFVTQFARMGFSVPEMIQMTACGHTLGGVHSSEFPDIVPPGTAANGQVGTDSTVAVFDNKVVTEYLGGTTTNPLVVGPVVARRSDLKVYSRDNNATVRTLADAEAFSTTCASILQRMIDLVPEGVSLTQTPLQPYTLKPVGMQLTLNPGGTTLGLAGYIRMREKTQPTGQILSITLTWKDRDGGNKCGAAGAAGCSTTATLQGTGTGFDDSFGFFPISASIDATTGISSFAITLNKKDGTTEVFDNNGQWYPLGDAVMLQKPQSCLLQTPGTLTATAVVRNDRLSQTVNLTVQYLVPRNTRDGNPVPVLQTATMPMTAGVCVGAYTFHSVNYTIAGGRSYQARLDVVSGSGAGARSDSFRAASELAGSCIEYQGGATCWSGDVGGSLSLSASATGGGSSRDGSSSSTTIATTNNPNTSSSSSLAPMPTRVNKQQVGGYSRVGCWTEASGVRALKDAAFAYDSMTLESCMKNCSSGGGFAFFGAEYGRECYCGSTLAASSTNAPNADCNMPCGGNPSEFCGGGNRLELYSTTATMAHPTPTAGPSVKLTVGTYTYQGCVTEATNGRALPARSATNVSMTLESCAQTCSTFKYFGTEYASECYCGNTLAATSESAPSSDCSMTCAGNSQQYCGGPSRLSLYANNETITPTGPLHPTKVSGSWTFFGCMTEGTGRRALADDSMASDTVTLESCTAFCVGFRFAGAEYGRECYCGNDFAAGSVNTSMAECSVSCAGNGSELCGAGNRLSVYVKG